MIEAIFVQSCHKELIDGRLTDLIKRILRTSVTGVDVYVFLNEYVHEYKYYTMLSDFSSIVNVIIVDDSNAFNPTTRIFHFLMNYKVKEYKCVLLLEADCVLLHGFDKTINNWIHHHLSNQEWFICGSQYGGTKWNNIVSGEDRIDFINHMNGVAVYNRSNDFLNHLNQVFVNRGLENIKTNYDFAYYGSLKSAYSKRCIDCECILNISDPIDENLRHENIKPNAVIIHTKCVNYTTKGKATECALLPHHNNISEYPHRIPVFVHVPKCAGTYALAVFGQLMFKYSQSKTWNKSKRLCVFVMNDNNLIVATLLIYDCNDITNNTQFRTASSSCYHKEIFLSDLLDGFDMGWKFFIFAASIESSGLRLLAKRVFDVICAANDGVPLFFTTIRDPFSAITSLFNYIKGDSSLHERNRRKISSTTFSEYVTSHEMPDSWIIRELAEVPHNEPISQAHIDIATSILDRFVISDISRVDDLINIVFSLCYNLTYSPTDKPIININKNTGGNFDKIQFTDLSSETQRLFAERTKCDQLIYNKYHKRCLKDAISNALKCGSQVTFKRSELAQKSSPI